VYLDRENKNTAYIIFAAKPTIKFETVAFAFAFALSVLE